MTRFVLHTGLNSQSNQSFSVVRINCTIFISEVPIIEPMREHFFHDLSQAIQNILNVSDEWHIDVWEDTTFAERRIDLNSNTAISIVLTSSLASPGDVAILNRKLNGQGLIDQLKSRGFQASKASLVQLTSQSSPGGTGPSSLVVGLCSAAGMLTGLVLLFCIKRCFFSSALESRNDRLSSFLNVLSKNKGNISFDESKEGPDTNNRMLDETIASVSHGEGGTSDCQCENIVTDLANTADYSKALNDVLLLIAGLNLSVESLVDPCLRKAMHTSIQHSNKIAPHDRAAALQILNRFERDAELLDHTTDQLEEALFQQQIGEGPLTELHFLALKHICESELHDRTAVKNDTVSDAFEVTNKQTNLLATETKGDLQLVGGGVACDEPLLDVLLLLKKCDLEPSYLLRKESRKVIEENLTNRQGPMLTEHWAVLQLISSAEIDSDLSIDSKRKHLLEQRIKEGPLNANHLRAAQSLSKLGGEESGKLAKIHLSGNAEMRVLSEESMGQLVTADLVYQSEPEQHKSCIAANTVNDLVSVVDSESKDCAGVVESKESFFIDMIGGLEVCSTLLTSEEKSVLQRMELRAKTARIRQSLPEWVTNGLAPPRPDPSLLVHLPSSMEKKVTDGAARHSSIREAVLISCNVRADIGFLSDFVLHPAQPKPSVQHEILDSLFFGEDRSLGIVIDDTRQSTGWQAALIDEHVCHDPGLSQTQLTGVSAVLAMLSNAFSQCLSCCQSVLSVLGTCCSVVFYLPCHNQQSRTS
jgi:hypothetical protein